MILEQVAAIRFGDAERTAAAAPACPRTASGRAALPLADAAARPAGYRRGDPRPLVGRPRTLIGVRLATFNLMHGRSVRDGVVDPDRLRIAAADARCRRDRAPGGRSRPAAQRPRRSDHDRRRRPRGEALLLRTGARRHSRGNGPDGHRCRRRRLAPALRDRAGQPVAGGRVAGRAATRCADPLTGCGARAGHLPPRRAACPGRRHRRVADRADDDRLDAFVVRTRLERPPATVGHPGATDDAGAASCCSPT